MAIEGMGKLTSEQLKQMHKNIQESPKQVEKAVKQKDDKQKLALALGALGAVGAATIGIAMKAKKGKVADVADMAQDGVKKLSDIKFEKGLAKQGKKLFTGNIEDTLNSGKKVTLKYKDGKIRNSIIFDLYSDGTIASKTKKVYDDKGKILHREEIHQGFKEVKNYINGKCVSNTSEHCSKIRP